MSEEVKEILDNIDIWYKENDLDYTRWFGLEELKQLKDYITNLQKEYENLEKLNNANYLSFIDVNKKRLKAIGFIKEEAGYDEEIRSCCCDLLYSNCDKLIEILGGDD